VLAHLRGQVGHQDHDHNCKLGRRQWGTLCGICSVSPVNTHTLPTHKWHSMSCLNSEHFHQKYCNFIITANQQFCWHQNSLYGWSIFTAWCTTVQSAVLLSHVICLSGRLSVMLVDHDHIGWKSWKLIARTISPTSSALRSPKIIHLLPGDHGEILGRKCSFNTYVHNIRLNWVKFNRESCDLRWRCGWWLFVYFCPRIVRSCLRLQSFLVVYWQHVSFGGQFE